MKGISKELDKDKVSEVIKDVEHNSCYLQDIINKVVSSYTEPLDDIMNKIYRDIISKDMSPSIDVVEKYFAELSNCTYYMGERVGNLSIFKSLSEKTYKEVYNNTYLEGAADKGLDKKSKKTVSELNSIAESSSIYENIVSEIYDEAYKVVKFKIEAAQTMISTLSKILSKKINEMSINGYASNGKQVLNENYFQGNNF